MKLIAVLTGNGEEMLAHAVRVMRGELVVEEEVVTKEGDVRTITHKPSIRDQAEARNFLANRFWGKSAETVKLEDARAPSNEIPLEDLPEELLLAKFELEQKLKALREARAGVVDAVVVSSERSPPADQAAPAADAPDVRLTSEQGSPEEPTEL